MGSFRRTYVAEGPDAHAIVAALGIRLCEVAARLGVTPGRVTQLCGSPAGARRVLEAAFAIYLAGGGA